MLVNRDIAARRVPRFHSGSACVVSAALASVAPAAAQDASFGCKVLLCAASVAPGWAGIPYCVPVMQQLFRQLARGGGWPVCSEAQASSVSYEPYLPGPSGFTPVAGDISTGDAEQASACADLTKPTQTCGAGADANCQTTYPTISWAARTDPNYVDLTTTAGVQRFYFSLKGF